MTIANTYFQSEKAPCGRIVDGQRHRDWDDECVLTDELFFACGCRVICHEYHDGSVSRRAIRHDGKVLEDSSEHHA